MSRRLVLLLCPPLFLLHPVSGGMANVVVEARGMASLMPSLKLLIPRQSTIVPLGRSWTAQDYVALCGGADISAGCTWVESFETSINNDGNRVLTIPNLQWRRVRKGAIRGWFYTSVKPPVDRYRHKVFVMASPSLVKLAEDICDTDFHRHCTGILIAFKVDSAPPPTSFYMPLVTFAQKGTGYFISSMFSRCNITNEMFASHNLHTGVLRSKMGLAESVDCRANTVRKTINVFDVDFRNSPDELKYAIKNKGKIGYGLYLEHLALWNILADSLGWKLQVTFPLPNNTKLKPRGWISSNHSEGFHQMLLLLYGKSDVTPFVEGAEFVVSSDGEPHPNILTRRVRFMPIEFTFACPLPSKMSVFYNIITPLQLTVWLAVVATLVLASLAGIIINHVYKAIPGRASGWSWYEVPLFCFSIFYAEAFPTKWEGTGAGRRVFNEFWKFGAMFIVFVYLCNLRSHLIKTVKMPAPNSLEELASPRYPYKLLAPPNMALMNASAKSLEEQGRIVTQLQGRGKDFNATVDNVNFRLST